MKKILFGCWFFLIATNIQAQAPVHGVWITNVDSQVLFSKDSIKRAVDVCKKNGINTIFTVVWNKGRTLYPSKVMKHTFDLEIDEQLIGRDPLREMIDAAHQQNIKVFAWFEFGFSADAYGKGVHILPKKPNWAALGKDGQVVVKNGFRWMNALDPVVQDFMLSLICEVVKKYPDLDGIQGDDRLPAMPSEAGYNPETLREFMSETKTTQVPEPLDSTWVDWRAQRLNLFMKKIFTEVKRINPKSVVSMSPSLYPWSKEQYLQDWPTWVREGWVEMVCPQVYRYKFDAYQREISKLLTQIPVDKHGILFPGVLLKVGKYKPSPEFLDQMIQENRKRGIMGEVFFFYEGLPK
jgi:uncharacterized lipoprotein YddW (UPF0748 family)